MMIPVFDLIIKNVAGRTGFKDTKYVGTGVPLKSNFLEKSWNAINCEISLILTWCENCVLKSVVFTVKYQNLQ